jgi:hypothetical protein
MPGDVVSIPVQDNLCAVAQVLRKKSIIYIAVFRGIRSCEEIDPDEAISSKPILTGWTMDAKIFRRDWKIISNKKLDDWDDLKRKYKVEYKGDIWVENFDGKLLSPASHDEIKNLFTRSSYSPARMEKAILAINGIIDWDREFDDLRVN